MKDELYILNSKISDNREINSIDVLSIDNVKNEVIDNFTTIINETRNEDDFYIKVQNISKMRKGSDILLVINYGKSKKNDLKEIVRKLTILNKKIIGAIFIKN